MNDGNNSGGSGDAGGGSGAPMSGPQSSPAADGSPVLVMPQTDRGTQQLLLLGGLGMGCFGMVMMLLAVGLIVWAVTRSPGGGPVLADREDQRQVVSNAPAESLDPKVGSPAVDEGAADAAIPSQHTEAVATSVGPASPPPVEEADMVDRSVSPERPPDESIVSAVELDSPPAEISVPKPNGPRPVYEFAAGDEFTYTFNVVADLGPAISKVSGECSYEVLDNAVQPPLEDPGSGTGFVVAENGYLITCAHVVTDSRHVTVTVDGKQYDGRVVGVDPEQDLALLKIPASGLQPLPLADSEKVRSAQDVHAVGYPLSDLLGNAIKVTRGTVAGVLDDVARKRFHIDAAINPGNSGGPIFDNRGGVIGIASAKLSGVDVSRVGFAIPSNAARSLLDKHRISPAAIREEASLTGPELVERVTPSVALIEVSVDPDRYQLFRLKYSGKMDYDAEKKDGSFTTIPGLSGLHFDRGYVTVTQTGQIFEFDSKEQLPFLLGPLSVFPLEDLETHGESHWGSEVQTTLTKYEQGRSRDPTTSNLFGRPERRVLKTYPAVESIQYSMVADEGERLVVRKTYELRTLDDEGAEPTQRHRGSGTLVFDKKLGMPISLNYRGNYEIRSEEDGLIRVPVNVKYQLQDPGGLKKEKQEPSIAVRTRPMPAAVPDLSAKESDEREAFRKDPKNALVARFVADIESGSTSARSRAFETLTRVPVAEELRSQVIEACESTLKSENLRESDMKTVIDVLCRYATEQEVPLLEKVLPLTDGHQVHYASTKILQALRTIGTPEAVQVIVSRLSDRRDHEAARDALIEVGVSVEEAVIEVLQQETFEGGPRAKQTARISALDVLRRVGTEKCLEAVKQLQSTTDDGRVRVGCINTLFTISRRLGIPDISGRPTARPTPSRSRPPASSSRRPDPASPSTEPKSIEVGDSLRLTLENRCKLEGGRAADFAFSPDGKALATVTSKNAQLHDLSTGNVIWKYEPPEGTYLGRLAFSADGTRLAVSIANGVQILDATTGQLKQDLQLMKKRVNDIAFSPDGRLLATSMDHGSSIEVWDLTSGTRVTDITTQGAAYSIDFTSNGKMLLASSLGPDGGFAFYNITTGQHAVRMSSGGCWYATYTADRKMILSTYNDKARLHDADSGGLKLEITSKELSGSWMSATKIPKRSLVVVAGGFLKAGIFDSRSGDQLATFPVKMKQFAASPDGNYLAFVDDSDTVGVWQLEGQDTSSE